MSDFTVGEIALHAAANGSRISAHWAETKNQLCAQPAVHLWLADTYHVLRGVCQVAWNAATYRMTDIAQPNDKINLIAA